ncbi:unnamed protein product [Amoebophrya sp. A120]|nr:unnamed protein product [Amoebophrya sp. A120]|eukprot:GSA120T00006522001.1
MSGAAPEIDLEELVRIRDQYRALLAQARERVGSTEAEVSTLSDQALEGGATRGAVGRATQSLPQPSAAPAQEICTRPPATNSGRSAASISGERFFDESSLHQHAAAAADSTRRYDHTSSAGADIVNIGGSGFAEHLDRSNHGGAGSTSEASSVASSSRSGRRAGRRKTMLEELVEYAESSACGKDERANSTCSWAEPNVAAQNSTWETGASVLLQGPFLFSGDRADDTRSAGASSSRADQVAVTGRGGRTPSGSANPRWQGTESYPVEVTPDLPLSTQRMNILEKLARDKVSVKAHALRDPASKSSNAAPSKSSSSAGSVIGSRRSGATQPPAYYGGAVAMGGRTQKSASSSTLAEQPRPLTDPDYSCISSSIVTNTVGGGAASLERMAKNREDASYTTELQSQDHNFVAHASSREEHDWPPGADRSYENDHLLASNFNVNEVTGEVLVPPDLRDKFNDACRELALRTITKVFEQKYFTALKNRTTRLHVERRKKEQPAEALKAGIAALARFFANRVSGITEASCLRELAALRADAQSHCKRTDRLKLWPSVLLSLAQWRRGWIRKFLTAAFWKIKIHATQTALLSRKRAEAPEDTKGHEGGQLSPSSHPDSVYFPPRTNLLASANFKASVSKDGAVSSFHYQL